MSRRFAPDAFGALPRFEKEDTMSKMLFPPGSGGFSLNCFSLDVDLTAAAASTVST